MCVRGKRPRERRERPAETESNTVTVRTVHIEFAVLEIYDRQSQERHGMM